MAWLLEKVESVTASAPPLLKMAPPRPGAPADLGVGGKMGPRIALPPRTWLLEKMQRLITTVPLLYSAPPWPAEGANASAPKSRPRVRVSPCSVKLAPLLMMKSRRVSLPSKVTLWPLASMKVFPVMILVEVKTMLPSQ